jgi:hypothetical protein
VKIEKPGLKIFKGKYSTDEFNFFHVNDDDNVYQFTFLVSGEDLSTVPTNEYYLKNIPFEKQGGLLVIKDYKKYIKLVPNNLSEIKIQKPSTIEAFRKDEDYHYYFYIGDRDFDFFNIPNDENCEIWIRHKEYGDINKVEKFLKNKKIPYTWRSEDFGDSKYFVIVFNRKFVNVVPEQR